jgi:hypothetical protein
MILSLILLQASMSQLPDIQLDIHATARSVRIETKGETRLSVRAEPDAGSKAETQVTPKVEGATKLNNVNVDIHAEARISDTQQNPDGAETSGPD